MNSTRQISKPDEAILLECSGRDTLLVSFGGIAQGLGIPVFEFFNSLQSLDPDKIFIRDFSQAWYQHGVNEECSSVKKLAGFLRKIINEGEYKKVCFLGNSMGGFAAILFGTLLQIDEVIAFAPQTFIDPIQRLIHRDRRWPKQIRKIYLRKWGNKRYVSLRRVIQTSSGTPKIQVYYSPQSVLDSVHVAKLDGLSNVSIHSIAEGGHSVVKELKKTGRLDRILQDSMLNDVQHGNSQQS